MQLHLRSAECHLFMGQLSAADELLSTIFAKAIDKAPAYVLQSRIFAQNGNSLAALVSLRECLAALDVALDDEPTWDRCDERFAKLAQEIQVTEHAALLRPKKSGDTIASIGAMLSETASAAWWSDCTSTT